jgi:hypothetical protein
MSEDTEPNTAVAVVGILSSGLVGLLGLTFIIGFVLAVL